MFFLSRPSVQDVDAFLRVSSELPLSYMPVGLAEYRQSGFKVDEQVAIVGSGEAAFLRATAALVDWAHVEVGWVEVFPKRASIAPGTVVAVLIQHLGFWSLNGCRVVSMATQRPPGVVSKEPSRRVPSLAARVKVRA